MPPFLSPSDYLVSRQKIPDGRKGLSVYFTWAVLFQCDQMLACSVSFVLIETVFRILA